MFIGLCFFPQALGDGKKRFLVIELNFLCWQVYVFSESVDFGENVF